MNLPRHPSANHHLYRSNDEAAACIGVWKVKTKYAKMRRGDLLSLHATKAKGLVGRMDVARLKGRLKGGRFGRSVGIVIDGFLRRWRERKTCWRELVGGGFGEECRLRNK